MLATLQGKIESGEARVAVIGLGYVGLPVAAMLAKVGFNVTGVDIIQERVDRINRGENPIEGDEPGLAELMAEVVSTGRLSATTAYDQLRDVDIILINVETLVDEQHIPRYHALRWVCQSLGPVLPEGALVIVESTIAPGTIDSLVIPLLSEHSGKTINEGFFVGACPERVMPGKLLKNIRTMSRVCGGSTPETAVCMVSLCRRSPLMTNFLCRRTPSFRSPFQVGWNSTIFKIVAFLQSWYYEHLTRMGLPALDRAIEARRDAARGDPCLAIGIACEAAVSVSCFVSCLTSRQASNNCGKVSSDGPLTFSAFRRKVDSKKSRVLKLYTGNSFSRACSKATSVRDTPAKDVPTNTITSALAIHSSMRRN